MKTSSPCTQPICQRWATVRTVSYTHLDVYKRQTFNFVVAIMYSQLFNLLCDKADDVYNGRLPVTVRCLLDEFAYIGQIPKFDKLIATIRSREDVYKRQSPLSPFSDMFSVPYSEHPLTIC